MNSIIATANGFFEIRWKHDHKNSDDKVNLIKNQIKKCWKTE